VAAAKIAVVGTTCSGKTTVARRLAQQHEVPHVELDALHWGLNWSEPSEEEFRRRVEEALAVDGWVADGGYHGKLGDFVLEQANLIVWLDPPLPTILGRLDARTARRIQGREELWGGTARPGAARSSAAIPSSSGRSRLTGRGASGTRSG
jgi:adenylate kinase family enzyme